MYTKIHRSSNSFPWCEYSDQYPTLINQDMVMFVLHICVYAYLIMLPLVFILTFIFRYAVFWV